MKRAPHAPQRNSQAFRNIHLSREMSIPEDAESSWGGVRGGPSYKKGLPDSYSLECERMLL